MFGRISAKLKSVNATELFQRDVISIKANFLLDVNSLTVVLKLCSAYSAIVITMVRHTLRDVKTENDNPFSTCLS